MQLPKAKSWVRNLGGLSKFYSIILWNDRAFTSKVGLKYRNIHSFLPPIVGSSGVLFLS